MIYFNNCKTVNEVKSLFKTLAMQHHPDRGGNTATMQTINAEYAFAIAKLLKGENLSNEEINEEIKLSNDYKEAIEKIINFEGIIIEIVGNWVWVTGNTYPVRAILKEAKFFFASKKCAWYFRGDDFKSANRKKMTLDEIKNKYGSQQINGKGDFKSKFLN